MTNVLLIIITVFVFFVRLGAAKPISKPDYGRAVSFMWDNVNIKKAFQLSVMPNWFADSTGFWYIHSTKK